MTYVDFAAVYTDRPCFTEREVRLAFPGFGDRQLHHWQRKGYVERLRKPWYRIAKRPWSQFERWTVANRVYAPSYISMESALSYHGFIPEGVFHITSVTTLHTREFDIGKTRYHYRNVKPGYFYGYDILEHEGAAVRMADAEKTLLDLLYLNARHRTADDFEALRLDRVGIRGALRPDVFADYLTLADNKALVQRAKSFMLWLHDHAR
ncbi:MAG: hypothetical protein JST41_09720 [Bacteroidetes bacterium]|nr:hypothetical protein [Bacteroidota bacterium]MCC6655957.1 hypothetical protein [Flavobacteriales bacterium]HMU13812.1 hypothetical protein [Flavobacteriales bacterium]HMZ48566.1 hypothetical protein [Flavobacteriales bacterium]HNI05719.1 hypothetical protein [Flavobacteriales bacterium]